jgi:hypothetical protein
MSDDGGVVSPGNSTARAPRLRLALPRLSPLTKRFLLIVVSALVLYNANFRELGLTDTLPATLLPESILRHGDLTLDEFSEVLRRGSYDGMVSLTRAVEWSSTIYEVGGHQRSAYPAGAAFLATPVYVVPVAFGWLDDFRDYRIAAKLSASLMVALSAGFLFLALARTCSPGSALLLAASYAFGTGAWTIASQALWQHGPAMLCLAFGLWLALRLGERESKTDAALLSVALAMAMLCRPQNALGAAAIGVFALLRRPRSWPFLLGPAALLLTWQLWYNQRAYHDLRGGYPAILTSEAHAWRGYTTETVLQQPLWEGLSGLLISPGKGLLVYTPAMLLPLVVLPVLAFRQPRSLASYLLFWVVASLLMLAKSRLWWGGTGYGPRYLLELLLPMTFAVGMFWQRLHVAVKLLFGVAVVFGVFAQIVGALTWECGWHHSPLWLDRALDRLWDWRDPEVLRCSQVLVTQGPKAPEFGPFAP